MVRGVSELVSSYRKYGNHVPFVLEILLFSVDYATLFVLFVEGHFCR